MMVANATGCSSIYGANLPTTPVDRERRGARPGVEQLAVRGQRRVRARHAPRARRAGRPRPPAARPLAPVVGRRPRRASSSTAPQETEPEIVAPARPRRRAARAARRRSTATARRTPGTCSRSPTTWCARASGSSAATAGPTTSASAASTTSCRSGRNVNVLVLDTEVYSNTGGQASQGDPARRGGQVRGGRQGAPARRTSARSPAPTATSTSPRSRWAPTTLQTTQGAARGRRLAGPVAGHRLQHVHRPRHRHVEVDDPPEGRGQERLLAAVPLPARARSSDGTAVQARLAQGRRSRSATSSPPRRASRSSQRTNPERAAELAELAQADVDERWRYYEQLAGMHRSGAARPARPGRRARGRRATPATATTTKETWHDRRPADPLPRARPALADRRLGLAAHRRAGHRAARSRTPAPAAIVLPSLFEEEILHEELELNRSLEAGTEQFAEALDYFPAIDAYHRRRRPLPRRPRSGSRPRSTVPVIAQPQRDARPGGWVRYARLMQDAGADALELNLYHVAADPRATAAEIEAADLDAHRGRPRRGRRSRWRSSSARTTRRSRTSPRQVVERRRRRAGAVQPLLPARPRPRHPRRRAAARAEPARGSCGCPLRWIAILRPQLGPGVSLAATSGVARRHRRGQGAHGRRRRRDDDVRAAAPRARAPRGPSRRAARRG